MQTLTFKYILSACCLSFLLPNICLSQSVLYSKLADPNPKNNIYTASNTDLSSWDLYKNNSLGFSLLYPSYWEISQPNKYTVLFSLNKNDGIVMISMTNVLTNSNLTNQVKAEGVLQQLRTHMAYSDSNVRHDPTSSLLIGGEGRPNEGLQMISSFSRGDTEFKQWTIAIPRNDVNIVHAWAYTSPSSIFLKYQHVAEKIASSLSFLVVGK